jgi:hypothetical protein
VLTGLRGEDSIAELCRRGRKVLFCFCYRSPRNEASAGGGLMACTAAMIGGSSHFTFPKERLAGLTPTDAPTVVVKS